MRIIISLIAVVFALLLLHSCDHRERAQEIPKELIKVLEHYKTDPKDSLKYLAACFLLENMEDKYTAGGRQYNIFFTFLDSISVVSSSEYNYVKAIDSFYKMNGTLTGDLERRYDLSSMRSDFLIQNIDLAFAAYENAPWKASIPFETFLDYILPYRVGNEPLEKFRPQFMNKYSECFQDASVTIKVAADSVLRMSSGKVGHLVTFPDSLPDFPLRSLLQLKGGTCREYSNLASYMMRSVALPVANDFTPQWPHRGGGHSWCALLISKDSCIDFEGATANHIGNHLRLSNTNRMAKAYRHTFSKQQNSLAMVHGNEPIPAFFNDPYIRDVSAFYFRCFNIKVKSKALDETPGKFAYIAVFDNKEWQPIQWGKIMNGQVIFTDMGKPAVYLPVLFTAAGNKPFSHPIQLDSFGVVRNLIPNEKITQTIKLKRKYPVFDWWNTRTQAMKGGYFQAANKPDFSDGVKIYTIDHVPEMTYQTVYIDKGKKYRYWRYVSPDNSYGSIAEVEFYSDSTIEQYGNIMGTDITIDRTNKEKAFDKNPLTMFDGDEPNGNWVGLDLNSSKEINKIRYLCWNDDNFIKTGEVYELFFWKDNGWRSLGQQTGDDSQVLVYEAAPTNALFLLRNLTKGKEERIFTYENGKQSWW